jgi:rhodanese-related sulfurtransferase
MRQWVWHKIGKEGGLLLLLAVPLAFATGLLHPKPPVWQKDALRPGEVRLETILEWPDVLWVDARGQAEFQQGHIPGAILLNEDEWEALFFDFVENWEPDQPVVVYCGGTDCQASHRVADRLRESLGVEDISVLKGGWQAWKERRP